MINFNFNTAGNERVLHFYTSQRYLFFKLTEQSSLMTSQFVLHRKSFKWPGWNRDHGQRQPPLGRRYRYQVLCGPQAVRAGRGRQWAGISLTYYSVYQAF